MSPKENPAYKCWDSMKQRCNNPNAPDYHRYGGRGIKVCARWLGSFFAFLTDMGERPPGHTIERKDVDGDYTPENCIWASRFEQAQNRRTARLVSMDGRTQSVAEWCVEFGIPRTEIYRVYARLNIGWSLYDALTIPKGGGRCG